LSRSARPSAEPLSLGDLGALAVLGGLPLAGFSAPVLAVKVSTPQVLDAAINRPMLKPTQANVEGKCRLFIRISLLAFVVSIINRANLFVPLSPS
jgi:hypothetical protein